MTEPMHVETDVLIIGSGAAGMYAAIEATRAGARVLLARPQPDRPRRRHRHGADDGRGRARHGDARPLEPSLRRHARPPAAGSATSRSRGCCARKAGRASGKWTSGASAGRARTAASRRRWRPATTGRAASMWIFSTPAPRCRRRCVPSSPGTRTIPRAGDLLVVDLLQADGEVTGAVALHVGRSRRSLISAEGDDRRDRRAHAALLAATAPPPTWAATAMRWRCARARRWSTWNSCSSFRSAIWRRG